MASGSSDAPSILLVPDTLGWTMDHIAQQLQRRLKGGVLITPFNSLRRASADLTLTLWWGQHALIRERVQTKHHVILVCDHYSWRGPESQQRMRLALAGCSALFVLSERLRDDMHAHRLTLPGRTYVVPDGVDLGLFTPRKLPPHFTVGWLGRSIGAEMRKRKGLDILIEACKRLGIPLRLLDTTQDHKLPHDQVPAWLEGCTVVACASQAEGTPCPVLEAAATARVPISTMVGIADQVIEHGVSGLLLERSVSTFMQGLHYLRSLAPEKLVEMGKQARQRVEQFSWAKSAPVWQAALDTVLSGKPLIQIPAAAVPARTEAPEAPVAPMGHPYRRTVPQAPKGAPVVYMAVDRTGWSFENIAHQVALQYGDRRRFETRTIHEFCRHETPLAGETLVCFWWQSVPQLKKHVLAHRTLACLYDFYSWHGKEKQLQEVLDQSDGLILSNEGLKAALVARKLRLPTTWVAPDGVDLTLFPQLALPTDFAVGWCGNSYTSKLTGTDDLKGLRRLREACERTDTPLRVLDSHAGQCIPHEQMASEFYAGISLYACFSLAEGGPNPVKEAASCGRACITTRVGDMGEFVLNGCSGFIIPRTDAALDEALRQARTADLRQMGAVARQRAEAWAWSRLVQNWGPALGLETAAAGTNPVPVIPTASRPVRLVPEHDPVARLVPAVEPVYPSKRALDANDVPRVLCLSDVRGWAFDVGMRDLERHITPRFACDHYFVGDYPRVPLPDQGRYDIIFSPYTRWSITHKLFYDRCVGALRSSCWFGDAPDKAPGPDQFIVVNRYRAFQVVTRRSYEQLAHACPNVRWLPNPVAMDRFPQQTPVTDLIAVWNGNAGRVTSNGQSVKGFYSHIVPSTTAAGVPLIYAEFATKRLKPEEMPGLYQQGSVFVHASLFEGCSKALLEAMASGLAVISTDVGQVGEMRINQLKHYGDTGIILVPREINAFVIALQQLRAAGPTRVAEMGALNRREVAERWSWSAWTKPYEEFLRKALG